MKSLKIFDLCQVRVVILILCLVIDLYLIKCKGQYVLKGQLGLSDEKIMS